jgi:hypothetical protein
MALLPAIASPMHGAVVPIAYSSLSNNTTTVVTFSNIPQGYQDLMIVSYVRQYTAAGISFYLRLNGSSYTHNTVILSGNGTGAASSFQSGTDGYLQVGQAATSASTSGIFASNTVHILNYANTSIYKTYLSRSAQDLNGSGYAAARAGVALLTSGITSIDCAVDGLSAIASGSTFALYGIRTVGQ